ncbi:hypothetical protein Poli38472_010344 [Pythium oligandrum]|uniref:DUF659 domain-containing protein n=1 Tax=Pythium oligandrum TaxID=41045 RepID=A0A8K1C2X3_PYTOL|nr:hypothetical protein Poli38472_010344 [Pythium oligandrum]|eukprot:TMW55462.1 hypothetical protein Poli38472_010344 [Pythium oligandrum]
MYGVSTTHGNYEPVRTTTVARLGVYQGARQRAQETKTNDESVVNAMMAVNSGLPSDGGGSPGDSLVPVSSESTSDVVDNLSMFFFSTGISPQHVNNPHLVQLLRRFAPFLSLPSETDLSGQLLDRAFYNVLDKVKREAEASEYKAVLVNSWFNWRGMDSPHHHRQHHQYPSLVYMTSLDDKDLFIEQAPQLASTSSEDYLTEQLASVIYFIGDHATGVVTDNTRENQAMWRRLKKIYPSQFFHGCASHGLRLFVKNIFTPSAVGEDMLFLDSIKEYPFIFLNDLMEACREVVTFFEETFDQSVRDQFNQGLRDEDIPHPHFPPRNEWYGLKGGFESFIAAAPVLRPLVASRSFGEVASPRERQRRMKIHVLVNDTEFVENLRTAVAILTPLEGMMDRIENEPNMPCSEVFYSFAREIPDALNKVEGVYKDQVEYLLYLNQTRFNGMYGDAHGIAYLLDPRFIGDGLAPEVRKNIEDTIFAIPPDNTTHITSSDTHTCARDQHAFATQRTEK